MVEATYGLNIPADNSSISTPQTRRMRAAMHCARQWQSFTGHVIDSLQDFADRLGFWPRLVFDRGFGNSSLITHLMAEGATFYIRLKGGRYVELDGQRCEVQRLERADTPVSLLGLALRVVRSPKGRRWKEPWYILTNDFDSSREKVLRIYYHRFEIEETFRDMKHIWELKRTRLHSPNSVKAILWFVVLGMALLYVLMGQVRFVRWATNPKKRLSWVRMAQEEYQRMVGRLVWVDR